MSTVEALTDLSDWAVVPDPERDNVAVAKRDIAAGSKLSYRDGAVSIAQFVRRGERFALSALPAGEFVYQYGQPFGRSRGIGRGELVVPEGIDNLLPRSGLEAAADPPPTKYKRRYLNKTFQGYERPDGRAGTRNYYLLAPTSMCASAVAARAAAELEGEKGLLDSCPALDGVAAIPHTEGCGCDSALPIDRLLRVLRGYLLHPNVGGCLIIDLGCEQSNCERVMDALGDALGASGRPVDWLTIQESGGTRASVEKAKAIVKSRLPRVNRERRRPCPMEKLVLGTQCGASDSFSGISANPLIGNVADKVVWGGGSVILSEIPEMAGTLSLLRPRFRNAETADKFRSAMKWYEDLAARMGLTMEANLVPKNKEGGLLNNYLKSLGAVIKGGSTVIEGVVGYGEPLGGRGLSIMQGPGGDLESVTGIVASGANLVCFSTGYGSIAGNAICPVVKVASNSAAFRRLPGDMDFDGGRLLEERVALDELGEELLGEVLAAASGKKTKGELCGQRQFQIWTAGKLPL